MSRITGTRAGLALCATISIVPGMTKGELFDLSAPASIEIQSQIESSGNLNEALYQAMDAGDLNKDGCDDIAVGVEGYDGEGDDEDVPGSVLIFYGSGGSETSAGALCNPDSLEETITSDEANDGFGRRIAITDLNDDGFADLAVSAPNRDLPGNGPLKPPVENVGAVYIYFGGSTGLGTGEVFKPVQPELTLMGTYAYEQVGLGLAKAGAVMGPTGEADHVKDLWIAEVSGGHGRVFILPGRESDIWPNNEIQPDKSPEDADTRWFSLEGNSDDIRVFGFQMITQPIDGQLHLVMSDYHANDNGGNSYDGQVYRTNIVSSTAARVGESNVEIFRGEPESTGWFGYSLALLPESEAIGAPSALWIGAPNWEPQSGVPVRGKIYIPPDYTAAYTDDQGQIDVLGLGSNMTILSDLDHDGMPEVAFGVPGDPAPGRVYLARSADLIAGDWTPLAAASPELTTRLIHRASQATSSTNLLWLDGWTHGTSGDRFGNSVATGDFNGDGHPDIAALAPYTSIGETTGLLTILWSVDTLFDQDGDRTISYAGVTESEDLLHESDVTVKAHDCNDDDKFVYPGAVETCNGVDDNCNGVIDEGVTTNYYPDGDDDGYGDKTGVPTPACPEDAPDDWVPVTDDSPSDCDDSEENTYPGANERCDGADNNCDQQVKGEDDVDNDEFCSFIDETLDAPVAHAPEDIADCDDGDPNVYPGAPQELCDGKDTDCNGVTPTGMVDADGDGIADGETDGDGDGYFPCQIDCNDADSTINPAASVNAGLAPDAACKSGSSVRLEFGCGAVQLNAAMAFLMGPALLATRRRRRNTSESKHSRS